MAKPIEIVLIVPEPKGPKFWGLVASTSKASAASLQINLEIIYAEQNNRFEVKKSIQEVLQRKNQPDYLLFRPLKGNADSIYNLIEQQKTKFVTLEQPLTKVETNTLKLPGEKFKYWIGNVLYDDKQASYDLAKNLFKQHTSKNKNSFYVTGIGGNFDTTSTLRNEGLINAVEESESIILNQIINMEWSPDVVRKKFDLLTRRYKQNDVFWCASDAMALEVANLINAEKSAASSSSIIGGFDWLPEALNKIKSGELHASAGGHFFMGAIAIIKIFDYHHGINRFAPYDQMEKYQIIDNDNVHLYLPLMTDNFWDSIDFTYFSHIKNKGKPLLKIENIFKQASVSK